MLPSEKETREEVERWQIEEIEKALEEADRGEFASAEEVERVFQRWTRGRRTDKG
jgi:predicted transcriptional regulator